MATIDARRAHALPKEDARKRAEELAQSMKERYDIEWRWDGDRLVFDAPRGAVKGLKGSVDVSDREVRVQLDLPFLMRMLKGQIESKVNEKLDKLL